MKWLLVLVLMTGCAGSWQQRTRTGLLMAHETVKGASRIAEPLLSSKCMAHAEQCRALIPGECAQLQKCQGTRDKLNRAVLMAHMVVADALSGLGIMEEKQAMGMLNRAIQLALQIREQLHELGILIKPEPASVKVSE